MNETLVLNSTIGILSLERECPTESLIEESKESWANQFEIFKLLRVRPQRTEEKPEEPMRETRTFVEKSAEEDRPYSSYSQIVHKKTMTELFPKASQRIQRFEELRENWNGDQALPPSAETLNHAYEVLSDLWRVACVRKTRPPEPKVTCGAHGDITFSWTIGEKELELGFRVDSGIPKYEYLVCLISDEASCEEGFFEGSLVSSPTFAALFSGL